MIKRLQALLPGVDFESLKLTAYINAYSALQIPLLAFVTPKIVKLTEAESVVRVRLDRRTRNHLGVMYFGALAMGAELSIALKAIQAIGRSGRRIDFIFKDFEAQFLKRADGHVHFVCAEADGVQELIDRAAASDERLEATFEGFACVPAKTSDPVMTYKLTLSVKRRV